MGWLTSTTIAQTWEKCPECPYLAQCRETEGAYRPDDAWCRKWEERQKRKRGARQTGE